MRKKLLGLASLLCATTLCVGGATLLNDNATTVAETAETTYTWSTSDGMSFTADELWQMDQMLTEIPRTVEFCANIGSATKNTMVFSNFPTGSVYSYFAVRYVKTSGNLDVFYTKKGSGSSQGFRSTATVLDEGYHNYSVVLGDNGGYVYVDGELVDTTPVTYVSNKSYEETFTELPGGYNYCVGGDPRSGNSGYVNDYNCEDAVTTPSRGQGGIGFVGYQKNKFWLGPLCYRIQSKNKEKTINKYLYYYLRVDISEKHYS